MNADPEPPRGLRPRRGGHNAARAEAERARQHSRQVRERTDEVLRRSAEVVTSVVQSFGDGSQYRSTRRALQAELTGLRDAMASLAVIEQAKGIIMAREDCGADQAFQVLVRLSQRRHEELRDIAHDIVTHTDRRRLKSVPTTPPAHQGRAGQPSARGDCQLARTARQRIDALRGVGRTRG